MVERYTYNYFLEYIPKGHPFPTEQQKRERRITYNFKDGILYGTYLDRFVSMISEIIQEPMSDWCICYIPASSQERTRKRYKNLTKLLSKRYNIKIAENAVHVNDYEPTHLTQNHLAQETVLQYYEVNDYYQKNIILIDDILTTGKTFTRIADMLMETGAKSVHGLFFAKTTHPAFDKI